MAKSYLLIVLSLFLVMRPAVACDQCGVPAWLEVRYDGEILRLKELIQRLPLKEEAIEERVRQCVASGINEEWARCFWREHQKESGDGALSQEEMEEIIALLKALYPHLSKPSVRAALVRENFFLPDSRG